MRVLFVSSGNSKNGISSLVFGQSDPHQMIIDGMPGRYFISAGKWQFEEGDFNTNESYDLRLENALKLYREGKL